LSGLRETLIATAVALPALFTVFWLISIPLRDVSIVDVAWGVAIALAGWIAFGVGGGDPDRALVMLVLVTLWGGRLAIYIGSRKLRDPGEDSRYTAMRERNAHGFVFVSLGRVFLLQAVLAWVIALTLIGSGTYRGELGWLDLVGVAWWVVGMVFEAGGDAQLARFKNDPNNKGKVMQSGLWRYTRHPNYFGEFCVWWGFFCLALSAGAWWTVVSPLIVTALVTRVSGAAHLEKSTMGKRPGYKEYVERTSGFFPRPPKKLPRP
jgi:steroid 5-alpha reductase family enzyme